MNSETPNTTAQAGAKAKQGRAERAYHHGDLRNGLLYAARAILGSNRWAI